MGCGASSATVPAVDVPTAETQIRPPEPHQPAQEAAQAGKAAGEPTEVNPSEDAVRVPIVSDQTAAAAAAAALCAAEEAAASAAALQAEAEAAAVAAADAEALKAKADAAAAALKIQAAHRGKLSRQQLEEQKVAALKIQAISLGRWRHFDAPYCILYGKH